MDIETGSNASQLQVSQLTSEQASATRLAQRTGSLAGLILLLSAGVLPTEMEIDANLVRATPSRITQGTIGSLVIRETVSSADILRALATVHDSLANSAVDLQDEAKSILYSQLWNLYES